MTPFDDLEVPEYILKYDGYRSNSFVGIIYFSSLEDTFTFNQKSDTYFKFNIEEEGLYEIIGNKGPILYSSETGSEIKSYHQRMGYYLRKGSYFGKGEKGAIFSIKKANYSLTKPLVIDHSISYQYVPTRKVDYLQILIKPQNRKYYLVSITNQDQATIDYGSSYYELDGYLLQKPNILLIPKANINYQITVEYYPYFNDRFSPALELITTEYSRPYFNDSFSIEYPYYNYHKLVVDHSGEYEISFNYVGTKPNPAIYDLTTHTYNFFASQDNSFRFYLEPGTYYLRNNAMDSLYQVKLNEG